MNIIFHGMHGLGDNLHQRAIIKYYLDQGHNIGLVTPWPQIYYDMPIEIYFPQRTLRTQAKNVGKHFHKTISPAILDNYQTSHKVWYTAASVQRTGAIFSAMLEDAGVPLSYNNFEFPVKPEWSKAMRKRIKADKPILFYRPLVSRSEWAGCDNRNPVKDSYYELFNEIRDLFHVVSVADLSPGIEWITSKPIEADSVYHDGELSFEEIAGLMSISAMAFCSPGFALVLAQAVRTPVACIFGGRENSSVYAPGALLTPTLGIDPVNSCVCFNHNHNCDKTIDMPSARRRLKEFAAKVL